MSAHVWQHDRSLRSYAEILYYADDNTDSGMDIEINSVPVEPRNWSEFLNLRGDYKYRPHSTGALAKMSFGYYVPLREVVHMMQDRTSNKGVVGCEYWMANAYSGVFYYHKGRLTVRLEQTATQKRGRDDTRLKTTTSRISAGAFLVGVCNENFLVQAHNKTTYVHAHAQSSALHFATLADKVNSRMNDHLRGTVQSELARVLGKDSTAQLGDYGRYVGPSGVKGKKKAVRPRRDPDSFSASDEEEDASELEHDCGESSTAPVARRSQDLGGKYANGGQDLDAAALPVVDDAGNEDFNAAVVLVVDDAPSDGPPHAGDGSPNAPRAGAVPARAKAKQPQKSGKAAPSGHGASGPPAQAGTSAAARAPGLPKLENNLRVRSIHDGTVGRIELLTHCGSRCKLRLPDHRLSKRSYAAHELEKTSFEPSDVCLIPVPTAKLVGSAVNVWWELEEDGEDGPHGQWYTATLSDANVNAGEGWFSVTYDGYGEQAR